MPAKKSLSRFTKANMEAWDQVAPMHKRALPEKLAAALKGKRPFKFDEGELKLLKTLPVKGKAVAHLCCNSGIELISLERMGASRCVGFDISKEFVTIAKSMAELGRSKSAFVQSDVYEIPREYHGKFDIVFISVGTLGWMPDLERFLSVASKLLKSKGAIYINDTHPFMNMMSVEPKDGLTPQYSYFRKKPIIESQGLDYVGKKSYQSKRKYWFQHTLGELFAALAHSGFQLERFEESPRDKSHDFHHLEKGKVQLPMMMTIVARK